MKLFLVLFFVPACLCFEVPEKGCNSQVQIDNDHYNLTRTYNIGENNAYAVETHYDVYGNLFFVKSEKTKNLTILFDIYVIEVNAQDPVKVGGLPDGQSYSIAIDRTYTDVYFGTKKGIYKYDYETARAELDSSEKLKLDMLFIDRDGNKYITESNNGVEDLYLLDGEKKIRYNALEAINEMAIDDKNNFIYLKQEKVFVLKKDALKPNYIGDVSYNGIAQITFYNEKVFVASQTLAYYHELKVRKLELINISEKVTAISFDKNGNFILGTYGKLLKYDKNSDCYLRMKSKDEINVN